MVCNLDVNDGIFYKMNNWYTGIQSTPFGVQSNWRHSRDHELFTTRDWSGDYGTTLRWNLGIEVVAAVAFSPMLVAGRRHRWEARGVADFPSQHHREAPKQLTTDENFKDL